MSDTSASVGDSKILIISFVYMRIKNIGAKVLKNISLDMPKSHWIYQILSKIILGSTKIKCFLD